MGTGDVLCTGTGGFVGGELLPRILAARPGSRVHCLLRARDAAELERRRLRILEYAAIDPSEGDRVVARAGDVERPDLGLGEARDALAGRVDEIFHCAASTRFDLALEDARRINRDGLRHVLAFARRAQVLGGLRRLHHVSSAYVSGARPGIVRVADAAAPGAFRNAYEQSKWEAEQELDAARGELPITCYRPSIVVGDSRTGRTLHFRVLYEPIKWVYFGKTNLLPCRPEVRVDVVPVDYVCDAIAWIAGRPESSGRTYHLSAGPAGAPAIAEIIELSLRIGNEVHAEEGLPPIRAPQIVTPDDAARAQGPLRDQLGKLFEVAAQVMRSHLPYMLEEQLFDDAETRAALAGSGLECRPLREYLGVLLRYARAHNYGEP